MAIYNGVFVLSLQQKYCQTQVKTTEVKLFFQAVVHYIFAENSGIIYSAV